MLRRETYALGALMHVLYEGCTARLQRPDFAELCQLYAAVLVSRHHEVCYSCYTRVCAPMWEWYKVKWMVCAKCRLAGESLHACTARHEKPHSSLRLFRHARIDSKHAHVYVLCLETAFYRASAHRMSVLWCSRLRYLLPRKDTLLHVTREADANRKDSRASVCPHKKLLKAVESCVKS